MGLFKRKVKAQMTPEQAQHIGKVMFLRTISNMFTAGDFTLKNSEIIFSAVLRLSNSLSCMPVKLYDGLNPAEDELSDLIAHEPNPTMTSCNFFKSMEACRDTEGDAYALKVYGAGMKLEKIDLLDPTRVTPCKDESGDLWYRIQPEDGQGYYIHNYYVIHIPFLSTNGYSSVNPISVLQGTLDYASKIERFSVSMLEKGINAALVLESPSNLSPEQREQTINSFREVYEKTGGNILLLESGLKANSMDLSPIDTKYFDVEKITRSRVANVYNIPPHLLGDYSDASFSSNEEQMIEFLVFTMLPIVTMYEQEFDRKLLTSEERRAGKHFKFDMNALIRANSTVAAEVNYKAVRSAWKTPNEIRASYGQKPEPGGDVLLISRDLIPLDITVNHTDLLLGKGGKANGKENVDMGQKPDGTA